MTGISEESWCASWLIDLEFALWDAAQGANHSNVTARQGKLKLLSDEADGWWSWDQEREGPRFLSLDDWQTTREARAARGKSDDGA